MEHNSQQGELVGRMLRGDGGYVWVRNNLSMRRMPVGVQFLYCVYTDISKDMEEKAQIRRQYEELLLRHYRMPEPGTLIAGHSDITKNKMLEIRDYMNTNILETFYNQALLEAFAQNHLEQEQECFVKLPYRKKGCYARFKVNLVEMPDTGDVTEILTVSDITERIISGRILNQLSVTSHDYIIGVDLGSDAYQIVSSRNTYCILPVRGCYSAEVANKADLAVAPKDKALFREALDPESIHRRLMAAGAYIFTYSITSGNGDIRTKNMTVSSIDTRLDRVCLICTDITESVRAQQGLLNMIAYTFDLAGLIDMNSKQFTMYTRQMILENLPPYQIDNYDEAVKQFILNYEMPVGVEGREQQFSTDYMLERLSGSPGKPWKKRLRQRKMQTGQKVNCFQP